MVPPWSHWHKGAMPQPRRWTDSRTTTKLHNHRLVVVYFPLPFNWWPCVTSSTLLPWDSAPQHWLHALRGLQSLETRQFIGHDSSSKHSFLNTVYDLTWDINGMFSFPECNKHVQPNKQSVLMHSGHYHRELLHPSQTTAGKVNVIH